MDEARNKDTARGAVGVAAVCVLMLLWPLLGSPPHGFFPVLKMSVAAGSVYAAAVLWGISPRYAPACFLLLASGGLHLFARMRRQEWVAFNWLAVAFFCLAALLILRRLRLEKQ